MASITRNVVGPFPPVCHPETDWLENEYDFAVCAWALAEKAEVQATSA